MTHLEPGVYPGIDDFNAALRRYAPGTAPSGTALAGWVSADLFTQGLRAIGNDVTRTALVRAINKLTAFTANGAYPPVDWRVAHTALTGLDCTAYVRAERDRFVPVFTTPQSVYSCYDQTGCGPHVDPDGDDAAAPARGARQVTQFLNYAVPGVPFGCVFALMAVGLVLTYKASGVFNLAFGAQAFVSALAYVSLDQDGWPRWASTVIAVLVIGPLVGVLLDRLLFRRIRTAVAAGQAGAVARPAGGAARSWPSSSPGRPRRSRRRPSSATPSGSTCTSARCRSADWSCRSAPPPSWWSADSSLLFRFTPVGLEMRAVVESPRMTELAGVNAGRVSAFAWILSSMMAALAGVLLAPLYSQLDPQNFTVLLVWGVAGAVIGRFASLPLALVGAWRWASPSR